MRYYPLSRYFRQRFGCRVQQITINAGFSCPNRDGARSLEGCSFCNNAGFSPNSRRAFGSVAEQLSHGINTARQQGKAEKFMAYFQAFTNTYGPVEHLRKLYDQVWEFPEVVGLAIGTRPDCVDDDKLQLIVNYTSRGEVWIEYGLQSAHDETLRAINRNHTYEDFVRAVEMTAGRGILQCVHTILGLPGEDREMMLETHRRLAGLPVDGIKIHLLHILKDTPLARDYDHGKVKLLSREGFVALVCDVLEILPPHMVIQRLQADAPREYLIAPHWCLDKQNILNEIHQKLVRRDSWQGKGLGFDISAVGHGN